MSPASLRLPSTQHPDAARIAAYSAAIAVNLIVLLAAMRPIAPHFLATVERPRATEVIFREPPPPVPPPPPIELQQIPKPVPTPHTAVVPKPTPVTPPVVVDEGQTTPKPVDTQPTLQPQVEAPPQPPAILPGIATLAYRASPLRFPVQGIRQHVQGTVLLRVLVDEQGKPIQVDIEHTSGSSLLDRSAREQVMAGWLFQPATVHGTPVKAWARVPVKFDLQDL